MNLRFLKIFRDLKNNKARSSLVVFALVIGLWGVGTLLVSSTILRHDIYFAYSNTKPPHVILNSNAFKQLNLEEFRRRPEIESAEFRDLSLLRVEVQPGEWIPLWLFGVENFQAPQLALIFAQQGPNAPREGSIFIERDGLHISKLQAGGEARIQSAGKIFSLPISGISYDPAQAPATQDHFIYAYSDLKTYSRITSAATHQRLIVRLRDVHSKSDVERLGKMMAKDLSNQNIHISTIQIPKFNEHPHQWQLNTLLLLQGTIGFLALFLGGVLVSQLMSSILARQIRQIGIMKALGASNTDVLSIYLLMIFSFGLASSLIAIPLAKISGMAFARFVADKLNFDIVTTHLPSSLYLLLFFMGLILPLLLSLPALLGGVRVSVLQALYKQDIPSQERPLTNTIARWLRPLTPLLRRIHAQTNSHKDTLPTALTLGIRNTFRQKRRLTVTIAAMALGVAIFATGFNVRQSLWNLLADVSEGMRHDVQVVLKFPRERDQALASFRNISNLQRIEVWNGGKGELQNQIVSTDDGVGMVALPFDTDLAHYRIEEGRWIEDADNTEVVMNMGAVEIYGNPKIGDRLTINRSGKSLLVTLVGKIWELDKPKIYIDLKRYDDAFNPNHLVNSLMFVGTSGDHASVANLKTQIEKRIADSDLDVLYVMSRYERVQVVYAHLNIILTTIVFLASVVLLVGALGMASAMGINIMERTREIGVLRAVGANHDDIQTIFVVEGVVVSLFSVALGLLLAYPLGQIAAPFFGHLMLGEGAVLRPAFSWPGLATTILITTSFGVLASFIPARSALQVSTKESIAYE